MYKFSWSCGYPDNFIQSNEEYEDINSLCDAILLKRGALICDHGIPDKMILFKVNYLSDKNEKDIVYFYRETEGFSKKQSVDNGSAENVRVVLHYIPEICPGTEMDIMTFRHVTGDEALRLARVLEPVLLKMWVNSIDVIDENGIRTYPVYEPLQNEIIEKTDPVLTERNIYSMHR